MYAIHSSRSWGAGHLGDWRELSQWVANLGGRVVSTLPLLAAFLDTHFCEASPYSPASRLFWNEFYIDIEQTPEFAGCRAAQRLVASGPFQQRLQAFRQDRLVDYAGQMAARREVLQVLARQFFSRPTSRRATFERFLLSRPEAAGLRAVPCDVRTCQSSLASMGRTAAEWQTPAGGLPG